MSDIIIRVHEGEVGPEGKSAYQVAVQNGFTGTEEEWLESLKGEAGLPGGNGKSAYEIAVENGFQGTAQEWLESLKGPKGDPGEVTELEVVDNLESEDADKALSANQGRILGAAIAHITQEIENARGEEETLADKLNVIAGSGNTVAGGVYSQTFTATEGQAEFTLTDTSGSAFLVVVENVVQTLSAGYTLNEAKNVVTLTSGATAGDTVTVYYFKASIIIGGAMSESEYAAITPEPVAGALYFLYADPA
jgi:hypothetical protein